jgi:hypothetical protein
MIERLVRNEAPSLLDTNKGNELIDAINALKLSTGENGIEVKANQNGSLSISLRRGEAGSLKYHPFEVTQISTDKAYINLGTINGIAPSNFEVAIGGGTEFLYLDVSCSASGVDSIQLRSKGTAPDGIEFSQNNLPSSFEYLIAIINGRKLQHQIANSNLSALPQVAYEQPKSSPSVGEYPNEVYWTWAISQA